MKNSKIVCYYLSGGSGLRAASHGGSDMLRTLSRIIWRIVLRNAFRKSEVLEEKLGVLFTKFPTKKLTYADTTFFIHIWWWYKTVKVIKKCVECIAVERVVHYIM